MTALGKHILVEFVGCIPEIMNDVSTIEKGMIKAAKKAGATVINSTFHHFSPYGVSGVVVIQESHLAIHTWPEYQYAAVDLFTCGDTVDPWVSFDFLKEVFKAKNYSAIEARRGSINLLERIDFDLKNMRQEAKKRKNPGLYNRNVWFTDKDDNQAMSLRYTGDILYEKSSEYQKVRVIDTYAYGKTLTIDNMVMCTQRDEAHYHEMIAHPVMLSHGNVKDILIIGGGDGGTVRELLKHDTVENITLVEIDKNVIEASEQFLPELASSFKNAKVEVKIEDGIKFVAESKNKYDLIVVDGSDPVGPAEGLFSDKFYHNCANLLTDNGVLITQSESPLFNPDAFTELNACLKNVFGTNQTHTLLFSIPTYPSGLWSFMIGTKGKINPAKAISEKQKDFVQKHELNYYNAQIHQASFALPNYVKKMVAEL